MLTLTPRERMLRVIRGQDVDRVPVTISVGPPGPAPIPSWQPLHDLVERYELDYVSGFVGPRKPQVKPSSEVQRDTNNPDWYELVTTYPTPQGDLTQITRCSRSGKPGYTLKYLIASVEDARRWLSLPDPEPPNVGGWAERLAQAGDRALLRVGIDHPMYEINWRTGSELWAYWMYDEWELVEELVDRAFRRVLRDLRHYIAHGCGPLFGWAGPELCIPPLARVQDFRDFVQRYDEQLFAEVHNAGGLVWVHCHGNMDPVLEGFIEMGVDCLHPIEPPPVCTAPLTDLKRRTAGRMTLEGGVESSAFELLPPEEMAAVVEGTMAAGKPGGRFIIAPTSSPGHWPQMSSHIAENYRVYVETAMRLAPYM
ncbi:MAG: hypothetical protein GX100_00420 [candidate division WS1 bacterium]|nr:hypothetical protein [candidate division WS1 bacterium]